MPGSWHPTPMNITAKLFPMFAPDLAKMCTVIAEDYRVHGRDITRPGFQAVALHRFGVWRAGLTTKIVRAPLTAIYRTAYAFVRNLYGIEIPYTVELGRRVVFEHQHGIVIHGNSIIGSGCVIRQGVTLGIRSMEHPSAAPVLGENVNVGAGAKILGAVFVGDNARIGANSVVLHNVPDGRLATGIPARVSGEERKSG